MKTSSVIEIDGTYREGGGQILRTALGLSCLLGSPVRIFNIRKGRKKPGLMPQHLASVSLAKRISGAVTSGDAMGSTELLFSPSEVKAGEYFLDISTAGSTSLVIQTVIPALLFSGGRSSLTIKGGTHVPFSPSFHFLRGVFANFLKRMGIILTLSIDSYGFYPGGGGRIRAEIFPVREIRPLVVTERGENLSLKIDSGAGNLPLMIAERQRDSALMVVQSGGDELSQVSKSEVFHVHTPGQGTFIYLQTETQHSVAGFTALGERGKRAETVGEEAAAEFFKYYSTGMALDPHMADQIVLYMALCSGESAFTTSSITEHLLTNLWVIGHFYQFRYSLEGEVGMPGEVRIGHSGSSR